MGHIQLRIEDNVKDAFAKKVGKRKMSKVLVRFIEKVNSTNKKDIKDPHLFI